MIGFARNAIVIGMMAYFSPVHDETPRQRLDALRNAPRDVLQSAITGAPRLAMQTVGAMDPQSRDALTRKIAELAR
jgi:hypothetical protein